MGNVNGREEDEDDESNGDDSINISKSRFPSSELMSNTPPQNPTRSRSPILFSPQIPVVPLQGDFPTIFKQDVPEDDYPPEQGIPTLITWSHGGNNVLVEGSWDSWRLRKAMHRSGKDHSLLLVLPSGIYHYKFIVDGEVKYIADLPHEMNDMGHVCNLLDVNDYMPENPESVTEFEAPPSPESSYSQTFPGDEDFAKEPMIVPSQLHLTVLGLPRNQASPLKPQHVVLNHVFIEKGWASQSMVALGLTHRFHSQVCDSRPL